ncbi:hypothetical protein ARMGADRAFT_1010711 [Armillaria gallica]|uniref:Uncharacterized protein n=1 Tax=Armillaria gallica TaxID=47427 RepID=A0A2H3E5F0_ARMGA|nr:hypothetical protein ARMGADRAFT_1010711 [Armillaria gallica]
MIHIDQNWRIGLSPRCSFFIILVILIFFIFGVILHTDDIRAVRCGASSCVELSALPQDSIAHPVYAASEKRPSLIVVRGCVGLAAA